MLRFIATLLVVLFAFFVLIAWKRAKKLGDYPSQNEAVLPTQGGYYHFVKQNEKHPKLSENDIIYIDYGGDIGKQYPPVGIAQYVLSLVESPNYDEERAVVRHLDFLISYAHRTPEDNLIYPYYFDWEVNGEIAPWYSSMAQGQIASAFLWGYRITNNQDYYDAAKKSILVLIEDNNKYRFYKEVSNGIWLKEYPNYRYTVLDGSLAAIAGVYDLWRSMPQEDSEKETVNTLLQLSVKGFKSEAKHFENGFFGHYFSDRLYLPSAIYYCSNLAWLDYLSGYDKELITIRNSYTQSINMLKKILAVYYNAIIARMPEKYIKPRF